PLSLPSQSTPNYSTTLPLHDALPISAELLANRHLRLRQTFARYVADTLPEEFWELKIDHHVPMITLPSSGEAAFSGWRPETSKSDRKSTSELQSPCNFVCRLLLEKKN